MTKYAAPSSVPEDFAGFRLFMVDELRKLGAALNELEADFVLLTEQNAAPTKLYNGLIAYADGTNWNPGSGRGFYGYANGAWTFLG